MDGTSIFLIVCACVISVFILGISFATLVKFQHPDDHNQAWFPKGIILISFWLIMATPMILPFDVGASAHVGIDSDVLWEIALASVAGFALYIVPFAFFYYEAEQEDVDAEGKRRGACDGQFWTAFCYALVFAAFILILTVILYATPANKAKVPVTLIQQLASNFEPICTSGTSVLQPFANMDTDAIACKAAGGGCASLGTTFQWKISVSYLVYLFALLAFIGWWFFFIFAGVGFFGLPMDLVNEFRTRPKPMSAATYYNECAALVTRCETQMLAAKDLRDGPNGAKQYMTAQTGFGQRFRQRKLDRNIVRAEQDFYDLRRDFEILKVSKEFSKSNPLWWYMKLVLGVIGLIITIFWILHIIIFVLPGQGNDWDPFLNQFFIDVSDISGSDFPLFGVMFYAIFVFWLMWCTITGAFKFGIRLLIFRLYPMEVGKTYVNAILANVWILLLCVFPLVQFVAQAFPVYARYTAIEALYGNQVRYLQGFSVFWRHSIFFWMLLGIVILSLPVYIWCPNSKKKELQKRIDEVGNRRQRRI